MDALAQFVSNMPTAASNAQDGYGTLLGEWLIADFDLGDRRIPLAGVVVLDKEAATANRLAGLIERLTERIGWYASDAVWLVQPEWNEVYRLAVTLLNGMRDCLHCNPQSQ
jgi:hypothetical protein